MKQPIELTPRQQNIINNLPNISLDILAFAIRDFWKNPYFGAVPYLDAMTSLNSINDNYGADSGRSIVAYFLANAPTWRGPFAKAVKAELNSRLKKR